MEKEEDDRRGEVVGKFEIASEGVFRVVLQQSEVPGSGYLHTPLVVAVVDREEPGKYWGDKYCGGTGDKRVRGQRYTEGTYEATTQPGLCQAQTTTQDEQQMSQQTVPIQSADGGSQTHGLIVSANDAPTIN